MSVEKGKKVKVDYKGTLNDGIVFDKSKDGCPLEFVVGSGQVITGFDKAVEGMSVNEEKTFTINANDAYGQKDERLKTKIPKDRFPEKFNPQKGMTLGLKNESGKNMPGTVVDINDDGIVVDLNHPLAGKDLTFSIKVVGIE